MDGNTRRRGEERGDRLGEEWERRGEEEYSIIVI